MLNLKEMSLKELFDASTFVEMQIVFNKQMIKVSGEYQVMVLTKHNEILDSMGDAIHQAIGEKGGGSTGALKVCRVCESRILPDRPHFLDRKGEVVCVRCWYGVYSEEGKGGE